jgi:hypothetical protein
LRGAINIPIDELPDRLGELPAASVRADIIAIIILHYLGVWRRRLGCRLGRCIDVNARFDTLELVSCTRRSIGAVST